MLWPGDIPTPPRGAPKFFLPAKPVPLHTVDMQHRIRSPLPASHTPTSASGALDHLGAYACPSGRVGIGSQVMMTASDHAGVDESATGKRDTVAAGTETQGTSGSVSLPPWLRSKGFSDEEKERIVQRIRRPGSAVVR